MQQVLKDAGFSQVESVDQLEGQTFCQDPHCEDTLVFPTQAKAELRKTNLPSEHKLIIQVRCAASSLAQLSFRSTSQIVVVIPPPARIPVSSHKSAQIVEKTPMNESDWTNELPERRLRLVCPEDA